MADLLVAPCSYVAAKFAVMPWHYSRAMPAGKLVKLGVWEDGEFIGAVIFGRGACNELLTPYRISVTEGCELVRIALSNHSSFVTEIVSGAIKCLKSTSPGLRIIVSFADPRQGHTGSIYQAGNWIYFGWSQVGGTLEYNVNGRWIHHRTMGSRYGAAGKKAADILGIEIRKPQRKHGYLFPLDRAMRRQIEPLSQPYPKRADVGEMESQPATSG